MKSVRFSNDGTQVATGGSDRNMFLWDLESSQELFRWSDHSGSVNAVRFNPGTKCKLIFKEILIIILEGLASCSDDKTIKIYDLRNNELLQHYNAHAGAVNMIDFHPSGFYMGSVSNDSKVKIWDLRKGTALFSLYGHSGAVQSITFSNAGDYFTTGGDDKMVLVWKSNFFRSNTTEQRAIKKKKRVVNNKLVTFPNKAVAESKELRMGVSQEEVNENNQTTYENIGITHMPKENPNKKYIELETDERVNRTLDTILTQLDKICVNMKVSILFS